MSDVSFEVKFSQLVDSALREKVPALMEYNVGFQILDKNEEDTRAVGVAVFVVNNVWLYMPIFFIEGSLKGMDLMYVKQNDVFVPARDNWIASFKEQGANTIGEAKKPGDKSVETMDDQGFEIQESEPSQIKVASEELREEMTGIVNKYLLNKVACDVKEKTSLANGLEALGEKAQCAFANTFMSSPDFANAVLRYHTVDDLLKFTGMFKAATEQKAKEKEQKTVEVIVDIGDTKAKSLTDSEKKQLVKNGFFIKDDRTNFSRIYNTRIDPGVLSNPSYSGVYELLMGDGSYQPVLVLFPDGDNRVGDANYPCSISSSKSGGKDTYLIYLDKPDYYLKRKATELFVKAPDPETLKKMTDKKAGTETTTSNFISKLRKEINKLDDVSKVPTTSKSSLSGGPYACLLIQGASKCFEVHMPYEKQFTDDTLLLGNNSIKFTNKEGNLARISNTVYCPNNARVLFKMPYNDARKNEAVGNLSTITAELIAKGSLRFLKVKATEGTAEVTVDNVSTGTIDKVAAVTYLADNLGLYAGQAQQIVKDAVRAKDSTKSYFLKLAAPYDVAAYEGSAPFMGGPSPKQETAVDESESEVGGQEQNNDSQAIVDKATRAAEAGIKEVFDTSVLKALVDVADLSEMRQDYIKDMIIGLDRVGRMLFLYYWHDEDFEERYGREDMDKLEESLKKVFVSMGDLVLFLKEKTANSPDNAESLFGSLSEDVGGAAATSSSGV